MNKKSDRSIELRLRAAVEFSPSGLLMIDHKGSIVLVNRAAERLFGYSRDELVGRPVEMLVPERFRKNHLGYRAAFLADPKAREMGAGRDLYGLRKDGTEVPVEIGLNPIETEEGIFVLSSIVDISSRKHAELRFRAAVESAPSGMVMVDSAGKIVLVNREIERMFGYSREELLGQTIEILVPEKFRSEHPELRMAFFRDPSIRWMGAGRELFGRRKDGTAIPVEIGLNPIETAEGIFVLSAVVDISARKEAEEERKRLEAQLRQSQKMEAVGTLAGGIAHDFNNILAGIIGCAELARTSVTGRQDVVADLDEILNFAERGKQIVERILTFSRRQERERKPIPLAQTVAEAIKLLRSAIPPSIEIQTQIDPKTPLILGDSTAIHQVLMNLANNAAQAMPDGGTIDVSLDPIYVRDTLARAHPDLREGHYCLLTLSDTGHGIENRHFEKVFEPFFTTKEPGSGTGLGLSVVHGIMKEHAGAVLLDSVVGQGTMVRCFFPALTAEPLEIVPPEYEAPRGNGEHIMYVEDERLLARVGERRLKTLGYRVTVLMDSHSALVAFRENPEDIDLVLTDYWMPRLTGLELAREIQRTRPGIPVILMTGLLEDLPEETLRTCGIRKVMVKPVTAEELAVAIHLVLNPDGTE